MPSPDERRRGDGVVRTATGRYMARYRMADGRQRSRTFDSLADARAWKRQMEADVRQAGLSAVDPRAGRTHIGVVASEWLASKAHLEVKTRHAYAEAWRVLIAPRWEKVPLNAVAPADVQAWITGLRTRRGLSASRAKKALGGLRQILAWAVRTRRLAASPLADVPISVGRQDPPDIRPLTHAEVDRVAGAMPTPETALMVEVMAYTGLRFSEAAGLTVASVKPDGSLFVSRAVVEMLGGDTPGLHPKDCKTHSTRVVPVPPHLTERVLAHATGRRAGEPLFTDDCTHGVWRASRFGVLLGRAAAQSGVGRAVRAKDLRDTAASLSIQSGASVKMVQALLGHASPVMTLTRYTGLFPGDLDDLAARLSAARNNTL